MKQLFWFIFLIILIGLTLFVVGIKSKKYHCERGDAQSCYDIGAVYEQIFLNPDKATEYYKKAGLK